MSEAFAKNTKKIKETSATNFVNVQYAPRHARTSYKKSQTLTQEIQGGPYVLKATGGFPTWKATNVMLTEGKWYYEIEICGDVGRNSRRKDQIQMARK